MTRRRTHKLGRRISSLMVGLLFLTVIGPPAGALPVQYADGGGSVTTAPEGVVTATLDAGLFHSCAIRTYGALACWGDDGYGQASPPAGTFSAVSGGTYHTCAVRTEGTLACWGENTHNKATPPTGTFTAVSAGDQHTCGLRTNGTVTCWGSNVSAQASPSGGTFKAIAAGHSHTCGLRIDSQVVCWGSNTFGQATPAAGLYRAIGAGGAHTCGLKVSGTISCWGYDDEGQSSAPSGLFIGVAVGNWHTCGVRPDSTVACWGWNAYGQASSPAGTFVSVSGGADNTCGVKVSGDATCWGSNQFGQNNAPSGTFTRRAVDGGLRHTCGIKTDGVVACWGANHQGQATPPDGTFRAISAGSGHTCGIRTDGTGTCWGEYGTYGQGSTPSSTVTAVSAFGDRTCWLRTDGQEECHGVNATSNIERPDELFTALATGLAGTCGLTASTFFKSVADQNILCWWPGHALSAAEPPHTTYTAVSAGLYHACGLKSDATLACWGDNAQGQTTAPAGTFTTVASGQRHNCALESDGTVSCWGWNFFGEAVAPFGTYTSVSSGERHNCGVNTDGEVACWGRNDNGEISSPGSLSDMTPPDTSITAGPSGPTNDVPVSFSFGSTELGSTFRCSVDGGTWTPCTSPQAYDTMSDGLHTFEVRAVDSGNNPDPTPASSNFTLDTQAPDTTLGGAVFGSRFSTAKSFPVAWSATDPNGIAGYDVQTKSARYDGGFGSFSTWRDDVTATSARFAARPGFGYCFRASATDNAGNTSQSSATRCVTTPVDDPSLSGSGWNRVSGVSGSYLGTVSRTSVKGRLLTAAGVQGKRIALVATKCSGCGTVDVVLGTTVLKRVSLNAKETAKRVVIPVAAFESLRTGTIKIKVVSDGKKVEIDGLGISRF